MLSWVMVPRAIADAQSDAITAKCLPTFALLMHPLLPLFRLAGGIQNVLARLFGMSRNQEAESQILQDLRNALHDQGQNDHLDETAQELIRNVLAFRAADAAEVMTPRTQVVAIDVKDGLQVALTAFVESGHSRIPVYEDTIDSIIGTVTARRAIRESTKKSKDQAALRSLLDPPILVPETKPVAELLRQFRAVKQKLAVVLDEYGGTAGIVTLSDVVGEIVGDFLEEHHQPTERIRQVERDLYDVAASLHVSEVNEALHLTIPEEEDFETLGGFVLARLGHIPQDGEFFVWDGTRYAVTEASDRRVMWVRVLRSA
jgi:CBS domain containing-hemolysin-like protein